ncbi:MAG: MlaE family ABC transporter permease, partial [Beijerinckiaceae bacterium]
MATALARDSHTPQFTAQKAGNAMRVQLEGEWTSEHGDAAEAAALDLTASVARVRSVTLDFSGVTRLDTRGAWLIDRLRQARVPDGLDTQYENASAEHAILLKEVGEQALDRQTGPRAPTFVDFLSDIGRAVCAAGRDFVHGVAFFGEIVAAFGRLILRPRNFRFPAFTNHLEQIALRGVPIITLISFLVGGIVAQQGIFQLQRFGATAFVVDLIGVLSLRELAVLLTAIMVAGRSGSAFTAEIGSMKMREEIDALKVMGLNPIDVLVVPRLIALIVALPILTFLAAMASLFGGALVAWMYGGVSPEVFLNRLQNVIGMNTFLVGLIKAPF